MKRRFVLAAGAALSLSTLSAGAQQGKWPTRPVRVIVPWAAGGGSDVTARIFAEKLSERWGQQVNVDNKPGGNTVIGAVEAARAAPDGYTLFLPSNSTLTVNQHTYSKLPYDPLRDYTFIGIVTGISLILVASNKLQARSLPEVLALAKKSPDTLTIGSGAGVQLQVEQWMRDWGVKFRYIPYKSGADVTRAILGGEIDLGLDGTPNNQPHVLSGAMKGLAVNTARRLPSMPNVPTLDELGIPHSAPPVYNSFVAPAGLPAELQRKISADIQAVIAMQDVRDRLTGLGVEPMWVGAEELARRVRDESAKLGPLIKELGIKMD